MAISKENWKSFYKLQDAVFLLLKDDLCSFYLTGGTALSRYYLNHRFSEDLDFFCPENGVFEESVNRIARLLTDASMINEQMIRISKTYARFFVGPSYELKIDFVYENLNHIGDYKVINGINIDNPSNILANKIGCIVSRDEPKDVLDIISIAESFSFNWEQAFFAAKTKQIIDETDVTMRLDSFPVELFKNVNWAFEAIALPYVKNKLKQITQDFFLGKNNSLGLNKPALSIFTGNNNP